MSTTADERFEVVDRATAAELARLRPEQRLQICLQLRTFVQNMLTAKLGRDHPDWTSADVRAAVIRRMQVS